MDGGGSLLPLHKTISIAVIVITVNVVSILATA
jgi:hypothetical protein